MVGWDSASRHYFARRWPPGSAPANCSRRAAAAGSMSGSGMYIREDRVEDAVAVAVATGPEHRCSASSSRCTVVAVTAAYSVPLPGRSVVSEGETSRSETAQIPAALWEGRTDCTRPHQHSCTHCKRQRAALPRSSHHSLTSNPRNDCRRSERANVWGMH